MRFAELATYPDLARAVFLPGVKNGRPKDEGLKSPLPSFEERYRTWQEEQISITYKFQERLEKAGKRKVSSRNLGLVAVGVLAILGGLDLSVTGGVVHAVAIPFADGGDVCTGVMVAGANNNARDVRVVVVPGEDGVRAQEFRFPGGSLALGTTAFCDEDREAVIRVTTVNSTGVAMSGVIGNGELAGLAQVGK